ncbi:semaphorin-6D isoform X1 [Xenopus laevis]|uniref:Semaphorin-6D isoform X1 n=1 Tax=Xenopus laevis TaxID=8355 RepID=A0A8J0TNK3_XENLA|nr:semaphorin-6D isoform X1 [Xenopus laevis]XP_041429568.1 semaphorin-6D isoform X1 [Xenopus laevis]
MYQVLLRGVFLLICSYLSSALVFPKDLTPIRIIEALTTSSYPWFRGLASDDDTALLGLDFQKMLKLNQTLFIAARDHVYAIDLRRAKEAIIPDKYVTWKTQAMENCAMRGKQRDECYNYIKVLVPKNDQTLIACGTNSFNPMCRNYKIKTLEQEGEEFNGQARCPFDAKQANVALFADGNLYSATMADFQASDAVIYRSLGEKSPVLRTVKYDSKWLREPHFIHAVEYGNYVYFFFREISMEYTTIGKVTFSRVARVCKNDMGGSPRVLEKYWTSFLKARLNCSVPGDSFFYFDVLQSVSDILTINNRPAVIGVFGTQANSITGSGVCAYYMDDIEKVFNGKFKEQKTTESAWTPIPEDKVPTPRPGCCAGFGKGASYKTSNEFPDETLSFIKSYPLLDEAVLSITETPWFTKTTSRFKLTHLAADTSAGPYGNFTVLFLGSEDGKVLKVLSSTTENSTVETLLLEDINVYNPAKCNVKKEDRRILGLQLDRENHALFVAFSSCIIRVPLSRCELYGTCRRSCLASRDPYCVWLKSGACASYRNDIRSSFEQDIGQSKNWGNCQDVVTSSGSVHSEGDSAYGKAPPSGDIAIDSVASLGHVTRLGYSPPGVTSDGYYQLSAWHTLKTQGVRQEVGSTEITKSVHFTFLIGCVFVAFVVGAIFSGLFVSCYCNHMFQKNKHVGRDPESSLQRPLSLRSLAKMNGLLESQSKEGRMEPTSPKLYTTLLHSDKEQTTETTKAESKDHLELSGLPTPETTPELPMKNLKAFKNQWERNQNCNNAKEIQGKSPVFHFPVSNSQVFQFPSTLVLPTNMHGYDQPLSGYVDDKKIPNSERALIRHSQCYLPKGVEMTTLDELLKHLPESSGSPRNMSGMMAISPQAVSPHSPMSFINKVQPKIPDTESAPYYSSSTLPRDSLPRRLDIPPDVTPQSCLEKQSRAQRHSLSSGHKLMNIGPGGPMISRQHSLGQGNRQHPPPLLTRMHSTGTPVPMESHNVFLSRQLSYQEQTAMSRSMVKRTLSLRPDVPPTSVFLPSSPVKEAAQFKY